MLACHVVSHSAICSMFVFHPANPCSEGMSVKYNDELYYVFVPQIFMDAANHILHGALNQSHQSLIHGYWQSNVPSLTIIITS